MSKSFPFYFTPKKSYFILVRNLYASVHGKFLIAMEPITSIAKKCGIGAYLIQASYCNLQFHSTVIRRKLYRQIPVKTGLDWLITYVQYTNITSNIRIQYDYKDCRTSVIKVITKRTAAMLKANSGTFWYR